MTIHDEYGRITPYELLLPDPDFAEERFDAIRDELADEPDARHDPGRFVVLEAVADVLQELKGPRDDQERLHQHGLLLYHAFHFREAGRPLYFLGTHAARYLVEAGPGAEVGSGVDPEPEGGADAACPPERAGYLQLPRNLFWIRPGGERPPEPADGLFWTVGDEERISVLVAAGIREDRPGFSVVPLPPVPLADAGAWLTTPVRDDGEDFESTLPGGQIERLYSFVAMGEVLKLVARLFRYLEGAPGAVSVEVAPGDRPGEEGTEEPEPGPGVGGRPPRPTDLEYRRIELIDDDGEEGPE